MARFSCCGLVHRSMSLVSLAAILLILAVPIFLLLVLLALTFKTPTIAPARVYAPGEYYEPTYSLAWQEPFAYEVKVYAALGSRALRNESFFNTAQLLWHIEPQQLTNRYPNFRRKVNVQIPSQLRSSPTADYALYAYMFIQQAGRFTPHPDSTDPYLVSRALPLVRWSNNISKRVDTMPPAAPSEEQAPKLLGVSSVSWAIVLENHSYTRRNIPSYLKVTHGYSNTRVYSPPLLANMFTKGQPEEKPLTALKDKQPVADVYQQTIDVELELSGIRQGWVSLKKVMTDLGERKKPIVVETTVPDPLNPRQSMTRSYTNWVEDVRLGMIRRASVPSLIYLGICSTLIFVTIPAFIRLVARLWSTPISRWIGASRSTVAILLIGSTINTIWLIAKSKTTLLVLKPELVAAAFIAARLDDMTFAPWVALSHLCRKIFRRKPSPDIARSSSAQQLSLIAENKEELDSTSVSVASNPYFRQPEPVIAIRREVDDIAMRWVHLLTLPVIAAVALCMLVDQKGKLWSWAFVEGVFAWSTRVFFCVAWLPQIIVNYKTKSGSLTPVTYNIIELSASVLAFISSYLMGDDMLVGVTMCSFPNVIIIMQRIVYYRRTKQD